ncbi:hypothetical protein L5515_009544 [Caenorhabditis briggsae]|uniref:Uncharacterized protein n=2 Tax=Caenorhabditis briggsae TaxID=6238 RepID=A0AAE9F4F9_CAEBR|nr:hypothetical protein L5515_009544 [Caenorhabditis briggsae]
MVCSEDLLMLKEAFLSSSSFQKFILKYKYFDENVDLQLLFGEPDLIDRDTWSFPYPDSDESLRLVHYDNRVFDFSKILNRCMVEHSLPLLDSSLPDSVLPLEEENLDYPKLH